MRQRELIGRLNRYKQQAEEFGTKPELVWLMETLPLWGHLVESIKQINRGLSLGEIERLQIPLDKLRECMLELEGLLESRRQR